jgi:uncharacterized protein (DUF934 family)
MLLIDRTGEIDDLWPRVEGDAPLPARGRALVDLARLAEAEASGLEIGVHIPPDTAADTLAPHFRRLALVSVGFPSFSDGRGFSIARRLRALGYRGRLRASGPVIADQFAYLLDCGFDEAAVPAGVAARQPVASWLAALGAISLGYQRGLAGRSSILERRRAGDG